jgi:predicted GIY-YIG superfamily endonuclease
LLKYRYLQPSFGSFGQAVSEEKILKKWANQKKELPVAAMFVNGSGRNVQSL